MRIPENRSPTIFMVYSARQQGDFLLRDIITVDSGKLTEYQSQHAYSALNAVPAIALTDFTFAPATKNIVMTVDRTHIIAAAQNGEKPLYKRKVNENRQHECKSKTCADFMPFLPPTSHSMITNSAIRHIQHISCHGCKQSQQALRRHWPPMATTSRPTVHNCAIPEIPLGLALSFLPA